VGGRGFETKWSLHWGFIFRNKNMADYCLVTSDRVQIQRHLEKLTVAKLLKKLAVYYRNLLITRMQESPHSSIIEVINI
jgi:hypothetical protein